MDLILADATGKELGYIQKADIDFEIGDTKSINDFVVEFKRYNWTGAIDYNCRVYSPGTEFGGVVREINTDTGADTVQVCGFSFRGMMDKKIIEPLSGQDYAVANGEINQIIKLKVEAEFPGLFRGSSVNTGVSVANFQFDRYCTLHQGLSKMLKSVNHKLRIRYVQRTETESAGVLVDAVPIVDNSDTYEFSSDGNIEFKMRDYRRGCNHLICLGKGELKDRIVVHLYVNQYGEIVVGQQYYSDSQEIVEVYDSSGSDRDDLIKNGTKKLKEIKDRKEYDMTMKRIDEDLDIGDIVGGRDYLTGAVLKKPIGRKIWTKSKGKESVDLKLQEAN